MSCISRDCGKGLSYGAGVREDESRGENLSNLGKHQTVEHKRLNFAQEFDVGHCLYVALHSFDLDVVAASDASHVTRSMMGLRWMQKGN
jgi:hypothetical protein